MGRGRNIVYESHCSTGPGASATAPDLRPRRPFEGLPLRREEPLKPKPPPLEPAEPAPPPETQERLPVVRVFVREYRFSGHSVFTTQELQTVAAPYVNREVTTEDLESLRNAVTLLYIQRGYVTSGAILPNIRPLTEGIVLIQIIEGKLSEINVEGARWLWPSYYQRRLALSAGPPVNIYNLQERLQLLQQDPRVQRINAELRRGAVSGESESECPRVGIPSLQGLAGVQ